MKQWNPPILAATVLAFGLWAIASPLEAQETAGGATPIPQADAASPGPVDLTGQGVAGDLAESAKVVWEANRLVNWLSPLVGLLVGLIAGRIAAWVCRWLARGLQERGWTAQRHVILSAAGPATLALATLGFQAGLVNFNMGDGLTHFCKHTLLLLASIAVLWYILNLVAVVEILFQRVIGRAESTLDQQLGPLICKSLRFFVVVIGVLFVADAVFEQPIGAWLAGLGLAGLAVSLAAQDSLKNLFGSITVLVDRPFRIGERIIYAGYDGVIEEIGFRSTRIRTATGHLVTIPNARIVDEPVENVARRPSIRRLLNVTITYDTPREKIERAVEILRAILEEEGIREPIHAVLDGNEFPPRVYFNDFNAESLNILVLYWYAPPAYWDYLEHAQKLNLRIFEEFEKAQIEFAFPTQTVYLAGDPKRELALRMLGEDLQRPGASKPTRKP